MQDTEILAFYKESFQMSLWNLRLEMIAKMIFRIG